MDEKNKTIEKVVFPATLEDLEYLSSNEKVYVIGMAEINGAYSERIYLVSNYENELN